jgi:glycerol-3-phosphate acyltransferase PlsY
MTLSPLLLLAAALGYLSGSIPFGLLLTRMAGMGDIRTIGSGNIGATNVLRTGNKTLAAGTLLLDGLKGLIPALGFLLIVGPLAGITAGFFALLGHIFPVWLKFKGGKGVATYIGVLFGLYWPAGLGFALIWLVTALISRMSSLSALVAVVLLPVGTFLAGQAAFAALFAVMAVIIIVKHEANIRRILSGVEPRIGQK